VVLVNDDAASLQGIPGAKEPSPYEICQMLPEMVVASSVYRRQGWIWALHCNFSSEEVQRICGSG
jgi:hypothetical protein